jgi:hypothetical protein
MQRKKKKLNKFDLDYKEGLKIYKGWQALNKKLEKSGMHGTDYYIDRVEQLEKKVKTLEAKLKRKGK